jgi:hypothetical protein
MLPALKRVVDSKTHMLHIFLLLSSFVMLWKALADKNPILLKLLYTKFCASLFAHCAYGQLFLLLAFAFSSLLSIIGIHSLSDFSVITGCGTLNFPSVAY